MFRIDSDGATANNRFSEGNPSLGRRPTVVSADFMNALQEELVGVIESQDISLSKSDDTQLLAALKSLLGFGGDTQISATINNNDGPISIEGLLFDKDNIKAAEISYDISRRTDTSNIHETGKIFATYNEDADDWRLSLASFGDDAGVVFRILATGQIQYTSNDLDGDNYSGRMRIAQILRFRQ